MTGITPDSDDPRFTAAVDLIGRTGARQFQIRYSDDEQPVIWVAAACWNNRWEAAAGMHPLTAVFRLCDAVIDGGTCTHCRRPAGFAPDPDSMPLDAIICWYQFDPSTGKFVKGCVS